MESRNSYTPIILFVIILFIASFLAMNKRNEEKIVVTEVSLQENTHGSGGSVATSYRLCVFSDNTMYNIELDGLWSNPSLKSKVKEGDTLYVETRGFNCPLLGLHPTITKIIDKK